jgi:hypothetical protein
MRREKKVEDVPYVYGNAKIERNIYFFNSQWLNINEEVGYWKLVICTKSIELKYSDRYLCKIKCKWRNRTKKTAQKVAERIT